MSKIDYYAFAETENLGSVTFGTGAELVLNGNAFYRSGLTGVSIPANVDYIGELCFTGCDNLTEINVDAGNVKYASEDGVLLDKAKKRLITCPAGKTGSYDVANTVTTLAFGAFEESKLSAVRMAEDSQLGTIGYRAFYGCANLESMDIPDSVQSIDNYAFAECGKLADVNISQDGQLGGIYKGAFYNCKGLASITIPDAVQEIAEYAFYGCSALTDVPISGTSRLKEIYGHAFEYAGITSLVMPESLEEVGEYAFNGAKLANLVFNETITDVGDYAFADCGLGEVTVLTIPGSVEYLGKGALKGVTALEEITIPFLGTYLGDRENGNMQMLFEVGMPNTLDKVVLLRETIVYSGSFSNDSHIESVILPEGIIDIEGYAFAYSPLEEINFPKTIKSIDDNAFMNTNLKEAALPDGVETLGKECFFNTDLKDISFPDSLVFIGRGCFAGTQLSRVKISKNINQIGEGAFSNCARLEYIEVDGENEKYTSVNGILYNSDCTKLLVVPCMIYGDITFPYSRHSY